MLGRMLTLLASQRAAFLLVALLLHANHSMAQNKNPIGASAVEIMAQTVLGEMVAVNTTAGSGSTTPLVRSLATRFRSAGFAAQDIMVAGEGSRSQNLVVRWRGRTRDKPIVVNAHLDVVGATRSEWSTNPFSLTVKDGYLYGRGVIDNKGPAAAVVAAMIALKRKGMVPERDIVLALTAGEETDIENGVRWLLANYRDVANAEYVINLDAGGATVSDGKISSFAVQVAEKIYLDIEMMAVGNGGHSAVPRGDNPVNRVARAVDRVARYQFPFKVGAVMQSYFRLTAPLRYGDIAEAMESLAEESGDLRALNVVIADPVIRAQLQTTCVTTMLNAGTAPNVIPQKATATINCRLLPGERQDAIIARLKDEVRDTSVVFNVSSPAVSSDASIPTKEFLAMIERVVSSEHGEVPAIPYMETGATDALWFRNAGIPTFGVAGYFLDYDDYRRIHGVDERISVKSFRQLVRYTDRLLRELALQ